MLPASPSAGTVTTATFWKKRFAWYCRCFHFPPYSMALQLATGQLSFSCQKSVPMQRGRRRRQPSTAVLIAIACWICETHSMFSALSGKRK